LGSEVSLVTGLDPHRADLYEIPKSSEAPRSQCTVAEAPDWFGSSLEESGLGIPEEPSDFLIEEGPFSLPPAEGEEWTAFARPW